MEQNKQSATNPATLPETKPARKPEKGNWKLFAVLAVCAAPMIASYLTYYVIKPTSRTNYGTLIDPRAHPIPKLDTATLDGKPAGLEAYKGKWIMLQVNGSDCGEACRKKMHDMRQLRLAQGKDMDRVERVWLVTDARPIETMVMREYEGMHILRADPKLVAGWLPVEHGAGLEDHLYMIDPLGNLMMRFPKQADPNKIKKDLSRLLRASRIG